MSSWMCFPVSGANDDEAGNNRNSLAKGSSNAPGDLGLANQSSAPQSTSLQASSLNVGSQNNTHNSIPQRFSSIFGHLNTAEAAAPTTTSQADPSAVSCGQLIEPFDRETAHSACQSRYPRLAPQIAPYRGPPCPSVTRAYPKSIPFESISNQANLVSDLASNSAAVSSSIIAAGQVGTVSHNATANAINTSGTFDPDSLTVSSPNTHSAGRFSHFSRTSPLESISNPGIFASSSENAGNSDRHSANPGGHNNHSAAKKRIIPMKLGFLSNKSNPSSHSANRNSDPYPTASAPFDFITKPNWLRSETKDASNWNNHPAARLEFDTIPEWLSSHPTNESISDACSTNQAGQLRRPASIGVLADLAGVTHTSNAASKSKALRSIRSRPSLFFRTKNMGTTQSKREDKGEEIELVGRKVKSEEGKNEEKKETGEKQTVPDAQQLANMLGNFDSQVLYEAKVWSDRIHEEKHIKDKESEGEGGVEEQIDGNGEEMTAEEKVRGKKREENARKRKNKQRKKAAKKVKEGIEVKEEKPEYDKWGNFIRPQESSTKFESWHNKSGHLVEKTTIIAETYVGYGITENKEVVTIPEPNPDYKLDARKVRLCHEVPRAP